MSQFARLTLSWGEDLFSRFVLVGVVAVSALLWMTVIDGQAASELIMKEGTTELKVPGLGENVRILQAAISTTGGFDNGGAGMTVTKLSTGKWQIDTVFPDTGSRPTVLCTVRDFNNARTCTYVLTTSGGKFRATLEARDINNTNQDTDISVVMIGNR